MYSRWILQTVLLLGTCMLPEAGKTQTTAKYPTGIEHVIVIGVDGLSPNGISKSKTPVIDAMIENGSIKWNVRTVLPSSSSPNWASMIMGAGPEIHGILDNDWEQSNATLPPVVSGNSGLFPTIFSVVKRADPNAEIGAVFHWDGFERLVEPESLSFHQHEESEDAATATFTDYIMRKSPRFAFLQLDHVDGAGHGSGHGTPAYFQAVAKADSLIGRVLAAIDKAGIRENTMVMITSDHGGVGYGHGGASPEETEIAMIFSGKGIKSGYLVRQQVYTYDLAATIAFALKAEVPYAWIGRPVKSAFSNFDEPTNLWAGRELINKPTIFPDKYLFAQAGGLYIDKPALVKMEVGGDRTEVRYTTDGSEPTKVSALYKEPFTLNNTSVVKARAYDQDGDHSLTAIGYFRMIRSGRGHGLHAKFYVGKNWKRLPDFTGLNAFREWNSYEFNLNRQQILSLPIKRDDSFAVSFTGYISVKTDGEYTFYTQSDDGSQLFIGNQKVVDNNETHGVVERSGKISLKKGLHPIKVNYFNEMGGFWLEVFYAGPGITKQIVPASQLFLSNQTNIRK